ncbi:hypothetical protein NMY22_g14424 [Coprinellus aureogranulatus]|nr:hypothetical protein NMY22_g14424 [Coprinellus aureogranulatus]
MPFDPEEFLPRLLEAAEKCCNDGSFLLSSVPNADRKTGELIARQLNAIWDILARIEDPVLLDEAELEHCVVLIDSVLVPLMEFLATPEELRKPKAESSRTGSVGRPSYDLDLERALQLHDMGNTWDDIAEAMGVGRKTLYRHLTDAGYSRERIPYFNIEEDDLDELIAMITLDHPFSGAIIIQGHLRSVGLNIEIGRIRESLKRVDEIGVSLRSKSTTKRRVYRVRGANSLYHQDGNEKLKPWGFYVHGCVDGYSRMVIYLVCSNNKRSKTVGSLFENAVAQYGWPSRVRGDFGTENNEIERMMIRKWGSQHRPYLRGRSINNIRIERLWRDVRKDSLERFRQLFLHMEDVGLLDPNNQLHLLALYIVFQPRIQKALDETRTSWNNHPIRTARNKTPVAIYQLSREYAINAGYWYGDPGDDVGCVDESYGEDFGDDGEPDIRPPEEELESDPVAPRSDSFASVEEEKEAGIVINDDEEIAEALTVLQGMDLQSDDGVFGMDLYCQAVVRLTAHCGHK